MNESEIFDQRLPKTEILRKRTEFNEVFEKGSIWNGKFMKCLFMESNRRTVGFVVSRRFGNAVKRNRIKRLMREVYRKNRHFIGAFKIIIMPKDRFVQVPNEELEKEFNRFIVCSCSGKMC